MTDATDRDVETTDEVVARRDETVARVRDHAGRIARQLALLYGGDYGRETFRTGAGEWTVKYEAGDLEYLRFAGDRGGEVYVVSTQQPPEPDDLARAMRDYDAFVGAYNEHVESLTGVLDDVPDSFPEPATTETVAAERDRVVERVRAVADAMAGQLHRYEGSEYGTFAARVGGTRWELKREGDLASYLRLGGEGGTYLLSQYGPPSALDVREHADDVEAFVAAFNERVASLEADLSEVSFGD